MCIQSIILRMSRSRERKVYDLPRLATVTEKNCAVNHAYSPLKQCVRSRENVDLNTETSMTLLDWQQRLRTTALTTMHNRAYIQCVQSREDVGSDANIFVSIKIRVSDVDNMMSGEYVPLMSGLDIFLPFETEGRHKLHLSNSLPTLIFSTFLFQKARHVSCPSVNGFLEPPTTPQLYSITLPASSRRKFATIGSTSTFCSRYSFRTGSVRSLSLPNETPSPGHNFPFFKM